MSLTLTRRFAGWLLPALLVLSARGQVRLDEIRPWTGDTGVGDATENLVELYNAGALSQDLSGWQLGSQSDLDALLLPAWILPPGAVLEIDFGAGADDMDFSDGRAVVHPFEPGFDLQREAGELALYNGPPSDASIVDFLAWGVGGSSAGQARLHAQSAGIWPLGQWVELGSHSQLAQLGRLPSGYDTDEPSNWYALELPLTTGARLNNPIQLTPRDKTLQENLSLLAWQSLAGVSQYTVEVDDDSTFASPFLSQVTSQTSLSVSLADGLWFWRVLPDLPGSHPAAVWWVVQASLRSGAISAVPQRLQHKDGSLLCIWGYPPHVAPTPMPRGGCTEAAGRSGPWDAAHPATLAHIPGCQHCANYCTRASIQMVNARYGGTLTQDEISYKLWFNGVVGPEGDLGHHIGAWPQANSAYSWAMNGVAITETIQGPAPFPFAALQTEIDADRPVITVIIPPGWFHTVVFTGYFEITLPFFGVYRFVQMTDPWPGRSGWYYHPAMPIVRYYRLPEGDMVGRLTDPNVTADADGDGVMNFDEGRQASEQTPRDFCSLFNNPDTDADQVGDKQDIRSYTFHDVDHPGHDNNALTFPDVDGDGLRAECDCDSDNGGDFDGGEDQNGDGASPVGGGETCVYDPDDDVIFISLLPPEPCGDCEEAYTLVGGTLHAFSLYHYELIESCPDPEDGDPLGWSGVVFTDEEGWLIETPLGCFPEGEYRVVLDVLSDHLYAEPDNWDPWLCFTVDCRVDAREQPATFALAPPAPNPFNPRTVLRWSLAQAGPARLELFNLRGERVRVLAEGLQERGPHELTLEAGGLASGIYLLRLEADGRSAVQRLLLER